MDDLSPERHRYLKKPLGNVSGELATSVTSTLIAAALISLAGALFAIFAKLSLRDVVAFRYLIAVTTLAAFAATAGVVVYLLGSRRSSAMGTSVSGQLVTMQQGIAQDMASLKDDLIEHLTFLEDHIPSVDWCYDTAEHDRGVYLRLKKMVDNPDILELKVVTIFRDPKFEEVSPAQREAVRNYYSCVENALYTRRGFDYDRVVVVREALRHQRSASDLVTSLIAARPDFVEHYRRVSTMNTLPPGARSGIRLYGDTGRLVDVAFAIALDKQKVPRTLVLEIGTTRPTDDLTGSEHPALGLLAFENPSPQLADAFLLAHQALRTGTTTLEHVADDEFRRLLGIR